VKPTFVTG